jgi:hypothetical protein
MCWLATSSQAGGIFGSTGNFYVTDPQGAVLQIPLPLGVAATNQRPSFALYNGDGKSRTYLTGGWTDNLVLTENFTLARQTILPPANPLVNASGIGFNVGVQATTGTVTGNCICYIRFLDAINQRRSPLSASSPTFALAGQGRAWNNLPTTSEDSCVTDIEGWVSMDGGLPRLAWTRNIGVTSVTESLETALLGLAETETLTRFPRCRFSVMWNDRQVMSGDDRHPDRIYLSSLNEPESYGGFYLRSRKGEKVIGLISMRKQLIVLCATSSYVVEGYTEDDITMDILEAEIGGISHFAVSQVDGWAIVPSQRGIYLCTGSSFHNMSKEYEYTWRNEYENNIDNYEASWAVNDLDITTYKLFVGAHSLAEAACATTYWALDYSPTIQEAGGNFGQPALSLDCRARIDSSACILRLPGSRRGYLYTGSYEGKIRQENVDVNGMTTTGWDDDGDSYQKKMRIQFPHYFPMGGGGAEREDGFSFPMCWAMVQADNNAYSVTCKAGDEGAVRSKVNTLGTHFESIAAGAATDTQNNTLVPKCVTDWKPGILGRGITFLLEMLSPQSGLDSKNDQRVRVAGVGFTAIPNKNQRPIEIVGVPPL